MPNIQDVHARLKAKKQEAAEIKKAFKDSLTHHPRHAKLLETLKTVKEEIKSIENQEWAQASKDAERLDLLATDIKSDKELLADMAINAVAAGKPVEIVDEHNVRWAPAYSVTFRKDEEGVAEKPRA